MKMSNNLINEPIAIVGIGCRFPGNTNTAEDFWNMLVEKKNFVKEIPKERWDQRKYYDEDQNKPGKIYVKRAAFLEQNLDEFDPAFFGISPREAVTLDPQQRLLLEVAWEAIEDSGHTLDSLQAHKTGVFVGAFTTDNQVILLNNSNKENITSFTSSSITMTMLSNRISHVFDFKGPSVTVDTACSSSLVATHLACRSIQCGDSDVALVAGVNVMLLPEVFISMCKAKFLSPTEQCMAFDQRANGYVRSEGCGVVLLKPLNKAIGDGDRIYALIKESGVNQDGRTVGISLPNSDAQYEVINCVYNKAQIDRNEIVYVEAHGSGTQQGDYAECMALNKIFNQNINKCVIGSVKTNLGHTEAAAGVAGLIKASLCLYHKKIPANLHFEQPNKTIFTEEINLRVPVELENMPDNSSTHYVGVNSFGYGGTNAHLLLQSYDLSEHEDSKFTDITWPILYPLSARTQVSLTNLLIRHNEYINKMMISDEILADTLFNLCYRRTHHEYRAVVIAQNKEDLFQALVNHAKAGKDHRIIPATVPHNFNAKIAFVFTGMGPQWWGMAQELLQKNKIFREFVRECDEYFVGLSGWSLEEEILKSEVDSKIHQADVSQPLNFVLQIGLCKLLASWGISPNCVIGHSVGEISSAYASGALSLEDALKITFYRSKLQYTQAGTGGMLSVNISKQEALQLIKNYSLISIAAINSPTAVTLAGDLSELTRIAKQLDESGIYNRLLKVDIPYHSKQMDVIKNEFLASIKDIAPNKNNILMYSTVSGELIKGVDLTNNYWWENVRQPVEFYKALELIIQDGATLFLEVGPHPVTKNYIDEILKNMNQTAFVFSTLNRAIPAINHFYTTLAQLHASGIKLNWLPQFPRRGKQISLPIYPWDKKKYWISSDETLVARVTKSNYVFRSNKLDLPVPTWEVELNAMFFPYVEDHVVDNMKVFPGAAYVEAGIQLHHAIYQASEITLLDVDFTNMLVYQREELKNINVEYNPETNRYVVRSYSRTDNQNHWQTHANGIVKHLDKLAPGKKYDLNDLINKCNTKVSVDDIYFLLKKIGLDYKGDFKCLKEVSYYNQDVLAHIELTGYLDDQSEYFLHPAILDAAAQASIIVANNIDSSTPYVPTRIGRVNLYQAVGRCCWAYINIRNEKQGCIHEDIIFLNENGDVLAEMINFECKQLVRLDQNNIDLNSLLYSFEWINEPITKNRELTSKSIAFLLSEDENNLTKHLQLALIGKEVECIKYSVSNAQTPLSKITKSNKLNTFDDLCPLIKRYASDYPLIHLIYISEHKDYSKNEIEAYDSLLNYCNELTNIAKQIKSLSGYKMRVAIISHDSQIVLPHDKGSNLAASPLMSMGSLLNNEFDNIFCKSIDVSENYYIDQIVDEILSNDDTVDVVLRDDVRYVRKLRRVRNSEQAEKYKVVSSDNPVRYVNSVFQEIARIKPQHDQVEVLAKSITCYPSSMKNTKLNQTAVMEITGIIANLGSEVRGHIIGEEVKLFNSNCIQNYLTLNPSQLIRLKEFETNIIKMKPILPYAYAIYLLDLFLRNIEKEIVLIHEADTPVGLALVELLALKNKSLIVTLNSSENTKFFSDLNVLYVLDSNDPHLISKIYNYTQENGVGIAFVSNSHQIDQIRLMMSTNGSLIYHEALSHRKYFASPDFSCIKNINFFIVQIETFIHKNPSYLYHYSDFINKILTGKMAKVPTLSYEPHETQLVIQAVNSGRHLLNRLISFENKKIRVDQMDDVITCSTHESYIITGGCSGFGLELAKWLAKKNVGQLVLVSRSGPRTIYEKKTIENIKKLNVDVQIAFADVSNKNSLKEIVDNITESKYNLSGIFHCAMVLDDAFIVDTTSQRYENTVNPKVLGALYLHQLTKGLSLKYFVMTSSISTVIGNPGQGNYIAANAFLESLTLYRRSNQLPATTINIGVLTDVGVIARSERLTKYVDLLAIKKTSSQAVIKVLEAMLARDIAHQCVFDMEWSKWFRVDSRSANSSRFSELYEEIKNASDGATSDRKLLRETLGNNEQEALEILSTLLKDEIASIIKCSPDEIDIHKELISYGIDSLMISELRNRMISLFDIDISLVELLKNNSIQYIAKLINGKL